MKCLRILKIAPDKRLKVGMVVRVTDIYAEKLVVGGKAEYTNKNMWREAGKERI